jgi:DNA-binding response OmpR family regulator
MRRSPERPSDITRIEFPGGLADLARHEVRFDDGGRIELSQRESELLRYLVLNAGRTISRDEILANVWQITPQGVSTRTIDMHIARLRGKLRDDPTHPAVLVTVRGKGYMFALVPAPTE